MIVVMMMNFGFEYRSGFAMAGQVAKIDAGEDVLGRADGGGLAVFHEHEGIGEAQNLVHGVADIKDGDGEALGQIQIRLSR